MADLIKNKSVFYDLQEPTADDLNYIGQSVEEQIKVRGSDFYTNGVLDLDKFAIVLIDSSGNNSVTFSVGSGVAYIDGRRVEIPEGENKDYDLANPCKDPSNGECPSSTGNANITVSTNGKPVVTIFLLYAKDYDPNSYDINPETYTKRYTKERAGYAIALGVGSDPNNRPTVPSYPDEWTNYLETSNNPNWTIGNGKDGRSYIILADLIWDGTKWTVDKSRCQKVTLKEEIQPLGETEVHQTTFHTSGISKLTGRIFNYYRYAVKDSFNTNNFASGTLIKTLSPSITTKTAFVRIAVKDKGGNASLGIQINDDGPSVSVPVNKILDNGIHTVTVKFEDRNGLTINKIIVSATDISVNYSTNVNVPLIHLIYQEEVVTNTYDEYLIYTIPQLDPDSSDVGIDKGDAVLIRKSDPDSYIYVGGKRIEELRFKNNLLPVVDGFYRLENLTNADVSSESNKYLIIDKDGNLSFVTDITNLSDEKLPLAELIVDFTEVTPNVTFEISKDYRKPVDSHKPYRFAKYPIEIVPTKDSELQTPEIILSANTEPTTNIPYLPLKIRVENDNGRSKLVFEGSIGNNILTVLDNGNVGIGISNPNTTLEVNGNIKGTNLSLTSLTSGSVLFADGGGLISQDNNNLYWDNVNKRLGIGITNPPEKLTIAGNVGIQAGSDAFIGTLDNYGLSIKTNNIDRIYITNNGSVGIGTNPFRKLTVAGDIGLLAGTSAFIGTIDNYALGIGTNSTVRIYVTDTGEVGIGAVSAYAKLTVAGSIGIQGAYYPYIGTLDNSSLSIVTNNNSRIFIANDGRVSIGTTLPGEGQLYIVTYDVIPAIKGVGYCYGIYGFGNCTGIYGCSYNIGIYGFGNCTGIYGCSYNIGVCGFGGNVGVYGHSPSIGIYSCSNNVGICSYGGTIGICSYGGNVGICSCGYYAGICSFGNCVGIYGQGSVAVCGNGVNTGVIGSGCDVGVYGCSGNIGICSYGYWAGIRSCGDYIGIRSFGCYIGVCSCSDNIGVCSFGCYIGVYGCGCNTGVCGCGISLGVSGYSCCYTGVYGYGPVYGVYGNSNNTGVYGYGIVGVLGNGTGVGVYGFGDTYGVYGCSCHTGIYGSSNCYGVIGWGCTYDFYATGPGTNYGPFTGAHDTIYSQGEFQPGDVVVVKDICFKRRDGVSSVIPEISHTVVPCDKRVMGVYNVYLGCENCNHWVYKEGYTAQKFNWATVNALGEGLVKVKENEFGNIEIGDLLTTSDTPGFAMKQSDDIVHNYTLGKAVENVDWSTIPVDPEKGFKWTMVAVFYYAG